MTWVSKFRDARKVSFSPFFILIEIASGKQVRIPEAKASLHAQHVPSTYRSPMWEAQVSCMPNGRKIASQRL
ncbi:hypothetical protein MiSe_49490 [Microseira wollei NIES-4236]|uniref:Uncharacterized protein n=1 Tax=Microseira wollei NIES-4236 TaxID=2530354 RepID=A0AAV3XFC6_9CYAN|nr:hypothetical protein MiSe_49490 [Microseira wollei NIES-4236]